MNDDAVTWTQVSAVGVVICLVMMIKHLSAKVADLEAAVRQQKEESDAVPA